MRGIALIALALTFGYSQCVAGCALESIRPTQSTPPCHQHQNSSDIPQSEDGCSHAAAHPPVDVPDTPISVTAFALLVDPIGLEVLPAEITFAGLLGEVSASPPGFRSPLVPLRI